MTFGKNGDAGRQATKDQDIYISAQDTPMVF